MRINAEKKDTLCVRTFGGFSMNWNGQSITSGAKSGESQFTCLMQILLHNRERGVSREAAEEFLFGDRDLDNPHHAMQSVIYNAKKKLKAAGLPEVNYIEQRKGILYWTNQIAVSEDASEFEGLYGKAENAKNPEKKLELYLEACNIYSGEFLPAQTGTIWIAQEARRYHGMFCSSVEKAAQLLRMYQDYRQMEELGLRAAKLDPLADWETVTMEAYVSMGRYEDARKLYDDTVELYLTEQGLRPSGKMMKLLDKLGEQMEHGHEALDVIQDKLIEKPEEDGGGYLCSYPVFQGIYQMMERLMERGGQSVYLMLCTVVDSKGNPMKDGEMLDELSLRLKSAIQHSVRRGDVINRYGKGQYLVLLVNTTRENCKVVQKRINYRFVVGRQRTGIQYYVKSVFCMPEQKER